MATRAGAAWRVVIVNADDFGYDDAANRGVVEAFERGLASSTTLMANQPGFDEAVELAHERGLGSHLGVHLVLTKGVPLTDPIRRVARFCDADGSFRSWRADTHFWHVTRPERDALLRELTAQVERVRSAGLPVTHLDSHHHAHNEWAIAGCTVAVARALGVPRVRVARNCGPAIGRASSLYKATLNRRLRRHGLAGTRWFGEAADWLHLQAAGADHASLDDFELMTHPALDARGWLVDAYAGDQELAVLLAPVTGVRSAVSHAGARYEPARSADKTVGDP